LTNQYETTNIATKHPPGEVVMHLDGADLHQMFGAGLDWLRQNSQIVNALNVFPVPDGDTGTNMVLTMQSAWKRAEEHPSLEAGEVAQSFAQGAIRGARGNSGVILSQILRGFSEHLADSSTIDVEEFAAAMRQATQTAYKGVLKPVEGTILTVVREMADASSHAAAISPDLRFVFETTLLKGKQALDNTPNLLPVLKQAGVVDAGGQGLYCIMEGMNKYLGGEAMAPTAQIQVAQPQEIAPQPDLAIFVEDEWGYDIQYLIYGDKLDEDEIRDELLAMGGDSVVVGSAGNVVKVHVHNEDPGPFITYGASLGHLDDIVLENMTVQTLRRQGTWQEDGPQTKSIVSYTSDAQKNLKDCPGIVAVASGDGLVKVFESLGVCVIVVGGQTMNPSTEDLLKAAESLPHEKVIILPNNKNIILAARQAAEISGKDVHVLETRSVPEGIAAMFGFNAVATVEQNIHSMMAAYRDISTAEITRSVRDVTLDGIEVNEGDLIGIINGQLSCKSDNLAELVKQVLEGMDPDEESEVFTLYYGEPVEETEAERLLANLKPMFPQHEFEMLSGGQPHYHYLISAE